MSLFICEKCGALENTACCRYWTLAIDATRIKRGEQPRLKWSEELKDYEGHQYLCSECAELQYDESGNNPTVVPGKWHNDFDKEYPNAWTIRKMRKEKQIIN